MCSASTPCAPLPAERAENERCDAFERARRVGRCEVGEDLVELIDGRVGDSGVHDVTGLPDGHHSGRRSVLARVVVTDRAGLTFGQPTPIELALLFEHGHAEQAVAVEELHGAVRIAVTAGEAETVTGAPGSSEWRAHAVDRLGLSRDAAERGARRVGGNDAEELAGCVADAHEADGPHGVAVPIELLAP